MDGITELEDVGKFLIKSYDPRYMDFLHWLNNLEYLANFLHIQDNKMVKFLLNLIEPWSLSQIQQKVEPANPYYLPYEVLIYHLEQLYGDYQGEWAANYRFEIRDQYIGESTIQYVHALKRIASKTNLALRNNESIMIRFISGLKDEIIKKELRSTTNLTLDRAVAIAVHLEFILIWTKPTEGLEI